ncbi:uncharacterized protein LOC131152722 [Malania oleifera]|uniref:uncharacterized protein LOC131152722 n=1 Tax=Malania oleifera TaxID=397392 RepID=UPI0025AE6D56|nr:uncharacterized protein LOC131152722 [Malania oleifera]
MMSITSSHHCNWPLGVHNDIFKGRIIKIPFLGYHGPYCPHKGLTVFQGQHIASYCQGPRRHRLICLSTLDDEMDPDDSEENIWEKECTKGETGGVNSEILRENLERIVGTDDSTFSGIDLAALIRNKYGRSYDVQLIKKEFMGRNLLAMNVMWKYMEQVKLSLGSRLGSGLSKNGGKACQHPPLPDPTQSGSLVHWRSFPLTEEEYLLRLDDVANNLKCWGAVSHIRNSLAKLKERPRIGKAVSIFIDMDESGGRANEWIYK